MDQFRTCRTLSLLLTIFFLFLSIDAQVFSAVSKHSRLRRRDVSLEPTLGTQTLLYAYLPPGQSHSHSAARLTLVPKYPSLILEDCGHQIASSYCSDGMMTVTFRSVSDLDIAIQAWNRDIKFVFISSDNTCTKDGEHGAHLVSYSSSDRSSQTARLSSEPIGLKGCTHKMSVDFGSHIMPEIDSSLRKRQSTSMNSSSTTTITPSVTLVTPTLTSLVASSTGTTITQPISWDVQNTTLFGGNISDSSFINTPAILDSISFKCIDCHMTGNIELKAGGFDINSNTSASGVLSDFIANGSVEFAAGLDVHMAFELDLLPGLTAAASTPDNMLHIGPKLTPIQLSPFGVTGVIVFGPLLDLEWPVDVSLNSTVAFQFGYELKVPDGSRIMVNMSNITNSYSTGFQDTTLKALPFSASAPNFTLNFDAGFRPSIVLGAYVGDSELIGAGAGVATYLDLPKLTGSLSVLENYTDDCSGPLPSGSQANKYIYLQAGIVTTGGVAENVDVDLLDYDLIPDQSLELYAVSLASLPTVCLPWDGKSTGIISAATASASSSASSKNVGTGLAQELKLSWFVSVSILLVWWFIV